MARTLTLWTPEDKAFWEQQGRAIANINLWISVPALFLRGVAAVERGGGEPERARLQVHAQRAVLAGGGAGPLGRDAAHLLLVHGAGVRRAALDCAVHGLAADPRGGHRRRHPGSGHELRHAARAGAAVRLRRRQFRLLDGQHQLLLSQGRERQCAGHQCRPGEYRRQPDAVPGSSSHSRCSERSAGRRRRPIRRCGCRMPASCGCR